MPLDHFAGEPRWVAWRNELRGDKFTKVPYAPNGDKARADAPATWGTRAEAEARATKILNGQGGGIGIELGDLGDDTYLAGIDLDSCLSERGTLAMWAQQILAAVPSYTEVSPSGRGLKVFFSCAAENVRPFLELAGIANPEQWGFKRAIGKDARDHGPAVELYFARRYFVVTENTWQTQPDKVGADTSRSAAAFRKGAALRRVGKTFNEMVAALQADPETADWCREKGEANGGRELSRIWEKAAPKPREGRIIRVTAGFLHEAADAGLAAMVDAGVPFYQRDRKLVRVCLVKAKNADGEIILVPGVLPVATAILRRALGQSARWEKINSRRELNQIDPPKDVVDQIDCMVGEWPFPPLTGTIGTPTLRHDGTLLDQEGYDPSTGLVLMLGNLKMPCSPDHPNEDDARYALETLDELLCQFPFVDGASRAAALSMLMTPVLRAALAPAVPMHLISKPKPGTGGSYLVDIAAVIATGERAPVLSMSIDPKETESRLISAALAGSPIISLDNCSGVLTGDFLCQVTERPLLLLRPLGKSEVVRIPNTYSVFANGNNTVTADDMVRRTLCVGLDANMENPEERVFESNPLEMVQADRGKYVAACLTIGRAYVLAGRPDRPRSLPSFERWSDVVRGALMWLGRPDPVKTLATARVDDPVMQERATLFSAWASELTLGTGYLTSELIEATQKNDPYGKWTRPELRTALIGCASSGPGDCISSKRLGKWLGRNKNTIALGYKLTVDHRDTTRPRWRLTRP